MSEIFIVYPLVFEITMYPTIPDKTKGIHPRKDVYARIKEKHPIAAKKPRTQRMIDFLSFKKR